MPCAKECFASFICPRPCIANVAGNGEAKERKPTRKKTLAAAGDGHASPAQTRTRNQTPTCRRARSAVVRAGRFLLPSAGAFPATPIWVLSFRQQTTPRSTLTCLFSYWRRAGRPISIWASGMQRSLKIWEAVSQRSVKATWEWLPTTK